MKNECARKKEKKMCAEKKQGKQRYVYEKKRKKIVCSETANVEYGTTIKRRENSGKNRYLHKGTKGVCVKGKTNS